MPDPEVEEGRAQKNTDRILNKIEQASKYNNVSTSLYLRAF